MKNQLKLLNYFWISIFISLPVVAQVPSLTSFIPGLGPVGTTVTITGNNFNTTPSNNIVFFGATQATVTAASSTSLTVTVPGGASCSPLSVTDKISGLTGSSDKPFIPTFSCGSFVNSSSFAPKIDYNPSSNALNTAIGDLDGDGKPDLVASNYDAFTISVYRNSGSSGTISFDTKVDFTTANNPSSIALSDLDGDGKLDVVVVNTGSNSVSVFRNTSTTGSISFDTRQDDPFGTQLQDDIVIADFDGDGKQDMVVCLLNNYIYISRNTSTIGSISFGGGIGIGTAYTPGQIMAGDLDGDGKKDLAMTGDKYISLYRNTSISGTMSFASLVTLTTGNYTTDVQLADFNADGKSDLAVSNESANTISIFRNLSVSGTFTFQDKSDISTATSPRELIMADVDGDGQIDITVPCSGSNVVTVYKNTTNGGVTIAFGIAASYTTNASPKSVSIGDLDGDGRLDLAVSQYSSGAVSIFRNTIINGPAAITSFSTVSAVAGTIVSIYGSNFFNVSAASFGGVNAANFTVVSSNLIKAQVASGSSGSVSVTTGCGTSTLAGFTYLPSTPTPAISSFLPVSGLAGTSVTITGSNFNGTLSNNIVFFGATRAAVTAGSATSLTVTVPTGSTYQPISITDITTGKTAYSSTPFATTFCGGTIASGSYSSTTGTGPGSTYAQSVTTGDFDGDGLPDLAVGNQIPSSTVVIFRNTTSAGTLSFAPRVDLPISCAPYDIVTGDMNGDGKLDIAVAGSGSISVLINNSTSGTISFAAKVDLTLNGTNSSGLAIGDLDGDGKLDLASANGNTLISVFRNVCSGSTIAFDVKQDIISGTGNNVTENVTDVEIRDLDGDGKSELIGVDYNSDFLSVFRNTSTLGNISFAAKLDISTGSGSQPASIASGDIDGDGKPDLAVSNLNLNNISVLRNTSTIGLISFATAVNLGSGIQPSTLTMGDLNGDGKPDLALVSIGGATPAVAVFENHSTSGTVLFANRISYSLGPVATYVAISDLDGDNKPDLIYTSLDDASWMVSIKKSIISATTTPPTVSSPVEYCINASSVPLTATGSNLLWYTGPAAGVGSSIAPAPSTGTAGSVTYYVSQSIIIGCESARTSIDVVVSSTLPAAPGVVTPVNYCQYDVASYLYATGSSLLWYSSSTGGTGTNVALIPSTDPAGTTPYYVSQTVGGCEGSRAMIEVIVTRQPNAPSVVTPVNYLQNDTPLPLTATGASLLWYDIPNGGVSNNVAPTPLTDNVGTTSYYVTQTVNGCESPTATIDVIVSTPSGIRTLVDISEVKAYPNPANNTLVIKVSLRMIGCTYSVNNMTGEKVQVGKLTEETTPVDISSLASGLYLLHIDGSEQTYKLMKR
jgi:trimeric autotransporter adhesin